jgi:hypothetical protein
VGNGDRIGRRAGVSLLEAKLIEYREVDLLRRS